MGLELEMNGLDVSVHARLRGELLVAVRTLEAKPLVDPLKEKARRAGLEFILSSAPRLKHEKVFF